MPVRDLLDAVARLRDPHSRANEVLRNLPLLRDYVESTLLQAVRFAKGRALWENPARSGTPGDPTFTAVAILESNASYQFARAVVRFVDRLPHAVRNILEDLYVRGARTRSDLSPEENASLQAVLEAIGRLIDEASPPSSQLQRMAS